MNLMRLPKNSNAEPKRVFDDIVKSMTNQGIIRDYMECEIAQEIEVENRW